MNVRPTLPFTVTSRDVWAIALPASLAFITEGRAQVIQRAVHQHEVCATLVKG